VHYDESIVMVTPGETYMRAQSRADENGEHSQH